MADIFKPESTVSIDATTSSARTALPANVEVAEVTNTGDDAVFIVFGGTSVTATVATGLPILPKVSALYELPSNVTHFAAITVSNTARVSVTKGTVVEK